MIQHKIHMSEDALFQEIGGEAVILDLASSTYFGLDAVGTRLWLLLQENNDLEAVTKILMQEFEVDRSQLEHDIEQFLQQLLDAGLVRLG